MSTRLPSLLGALVASMLAATAVSAAPACCQPAKAAAGACCQSSTVPAKPAGACCAEIKPAAPLTARSLYQLDATWTNDAGQPVRLAALRGRPVVLAMFFAQCEYACPILVNDIQRLVAAVPEDERAKAQLVLVSFDVERDTPAALKVYRERAKLDARWTLLHGGTEAVQELAMLLGVKFKPDARGQFAHSNLITVLNAEGEITHQHAGLNGDVSQAAKVLAVASR